MAERPIFIATLHREKLVDEVMIDFRFFNGFSAAQKARSIQSLHQNAQEKGYRKILEVSTKSGEQIGWALSAFNLMVDYQDHWISVESAFQGSKVFENGMQYKDLYAVPPIQAKKDLRIRNSREIVGFEFEGVVV